LQGHAGCQTNRTQMKPSGAFGIDTILGNRGMGKQAGCRQEKKSKAHECGGSLALSRRAGQGPIAGSNAVLDARRGGSIHDFWSRRLECRSRGRPRSQRTVV
jgi:hypothetical protein